MSDQDEVPSVPVTLLRRRSSASSEARGHWRSLEELAQSDHFRAVLEREFPENASEWDDPEGRRHFMKMMGASLALAGLAGCTRQPEEKIVPYVQAPEELVPGRPLLFATAVLDAGYAKGVLVESNEGRPVKVEGNPDHPASLGASDVFGQASVLNLYDPDRSQTLTYLGDIRPWGSFLAAMRSAVEAQRPQGGSGIRVLTGAVTSPTLGHQLRELSTELPGLKWHQWEAAAGSGLRGAPGAGAEPRYRLDRADVVLSLEADFIGRGPANLRMTRELTARRRPAPAAPAGAPPTAPVLRLYVVESTPSLTGAQADHRLSVRASDIEPFANQLAAALGVAGHVAVAGAAHGEWIAPLARDLQNHRGRCVVMAGETQPAAVHALARAMNEALGAVGQSVDYLPAAEVSPVDPWASLRELVGEMNAGRVALLVMAGTNPVYTAPADLDFAAALDKVPLRVHLGLYYDETGERSHWHVPEAHSLEAWSDARAFDGTASVMQPLIAPLYGGRSIHELLATLTARPERTGYEIVRDYWRTQGGGDAAGFERSWRKALHDGVAVAAAATASSTSTSTGTATGAGAATGAGTGTGSVAAADAGGGGALELIFRPDSSVYDGRFANNGWLQELPRPLTKITWDNVALISPALGARLGIHVEATARGTLTDEVELRYRGRTVRAPAWIMPGHPDGAVTVHLGYGRRRAGRVGTGVGFNAYALRTSDAPWFGGGLEVARTGARVKLAVTQEHWSMEGRNLVRAVSVAEYGKDPQVVHAMGHDPDPAVTLYPPFKYEGHAWGMAIDLNACVGCNACVVACQSENNIPVVGKDEVARGREMHWLRVDRYYEGPPQDPQTYFQPVPCMHCENAPCEVVCPVAATVHSDEGLNDMVYNRCVGTRYCSNNCPYKVRRFNFFLYQDWDTASLKLMRNPEVTVRSRGVMEKCTYCVQRIQRARIDSRNEGRPIRDGEIQTACQQACPGQAIVFGDINQRESQVSAWKGEPRNYALLAELNTRPRTTYLAVVRNPNPEMPGLPAAAGPAHHD
jgi:MoCo/4Fe-4S cofactor protein with predicted Tat translocation signal